MSKIKIKDIVIMALMEALLIILSKIHFNIGPIPLTLQTFGVFIIPLLIGFKKSIIVFLTYIIMGIAGIPVFSNGGGWSYIFEPSFGFIVGFFFSSLVTSLASNKKNIYLKYITSTIGLLIINICGVIHMYLIMNFYLNLDKSISYILSVGVLPFIAKDFATMILSCIIYSRLQLIYNPKPIYEPSMNLFDF